MDELDSVELEPAIRNAIHEGHKDFFLLLERHGNFRIANYFEEKPGAILRAARHPGLIYWLASHSLFNSVSGNSLLEAARLGDLQAAKDLLEAGVDVNHRPHHAEKFGSALAAAVTSAGLGGDFEPDRVKTIQLLLDNGADPNLPLYSGQSGSALESTIFYYCEPRSDEKRAEFEFALPMDVLAILLKAGAKPAMVLDHGNHGSALAAAAYRGLKDMLALMVEVIGKDSAIECLRQSRRPERTRAIRFRKLRQSRQDTIAYLTDELGVDKEILHNIGLWQDSPEEVGTFEGEFFKYRPSQESKAQEPEIQESRIQEPNTEIFFQLLYIFAAVAAVAVVALSYGIFELRSQTPWGIPILSKYPNPIGS